MREIKFRCWDKEIQRWKCGELDKYGFFTGYDLKPGDVDMGGEDMKYAKPDELSDWMQYTGLKDRNGVEIYEGDVVRDDSRDNGADFAASLRRGDYKVTWSKENCCFSLGGYYMQISREQAARLKVIGNIYENPELLTDITSDKTEV